MCDVQTCMIVCFGCVQTWLPRSKSNEDWPYVGASSGVRSIGRSLRAVAVSQNGSYICEKILAERALWYHIAENSCMVLVCIRVWYMCAVSAKIKTITMNISSRGWQAMSQNFAPVKSSCCTVVECSIAVLLVFVGLLVFQNGKQTTRLLNSWLSSQNITNN